jgi:hypothetical protein
MQVVGWEDAIRTTGLKAWHSACSVNITKDIFLIFVSKEFIMFNLQRFAKAFTKRRLPASR